MKSQALLHPNCDLPLITLIALRKEKPYAKDRRLLETNLNKWKTQYPYPTRLYDSLPYFYVGCGLLTIVFLRDRVAAISGLTLISAGCIVWMMRYRYRRAFERSCGVMDLSELTDQKSRVKGLMEISWRVSLECGHPVIDAQHRRMFGICNLLINSVLTDQPKVATESLLDQLNDHTRDHFASEQSIHSRTEFPLSDEHIAHHQALLDKSLLLRQHFHDGQIGAGELISFLTYDVIHNHILKENLKLGVAATVAKF